MQQAQHDPRLPPVELVILHSANAKAVDPKQLKTCCKSIFYAFKSFLQNRPQVQARVWIQSAANSYVEQWVDTWVPRRVKVDVVDGDRQEDVIKGIAASSIVIMTDILSLLTPDSILITYEALASSPINTWISLVDTTTQEPTPVELRALGSRHYKTLVSNVPSTPAATRGVTLQTDFESWNDVARQPTLSLLQNRLLLSPIPSLALKAGTNSAPPPAVPWDRVAQMVDTAT